MRLGSFWGLTAPMFVLAFPQKEDALPYFRALSSTESGAVLQNLQQELLVLARIEELLEYREKTCVSEELGAVYYREHRVNGSTELADAVRREIAEMVVVQAVSQAKKGVYKKLEGLDETLYAFLDGKTFQVSRLKRTVREFVSILPELKFPQYQDAVKKYGLVANIPDYVIVNGKRRVVTKEEKQICTYYLNRHDDILWWIKMLRPEELQEELVFGVPFFNLIKRKPESLRYTVLNMFEYVKKGANSKVLESIIRSVREDTIRFKELVGKYVTPLGVSSIEVITKEDAKDILKKANTDSMAFFIRAIDNGVVVPTDFLREDFVRLISLHERMRNLVPEKLNQFFDVSIKDWNEFGEHISDLGVCGLNECQEELFEEALGVITMAANRIYRSADEIKRIEFIIKNDVEALLETLIPVGEVIGG